MRALSVIPGVAKSARLEELPEPSGPEGSVLIQAAAVGICGTDKDILEGGYGVAPPGRERLILGHESVGRVLEADPSSGFRPGDWVVGIVRRPDPVPCSSCAAGEWDMCRNGQYTEHGIKGLDGFARERYRLQPDEVVRVSPELGALGVLLEPTSVVAKAWEQIDRIAARSQWKPATCLVVGAGPIGLLAALLARQRGLKVDVLDRVTEGPKPALVRALGADYHAGKLEETCPEPDVILECTGVGSLVLEAMRHVATNGIVCLTGISSGGRVLSVDAAGLNRTLVLENTVVFGTVNANRRHYEAGAEALARADQTWLQGLITGRVPLEHWQEALEPGPMAVKTLLTFGAAT